jgi:HPt (histidine-containing phosphotransfer) domain-containing protein
MQVESVDVFDRDVALNRLDGDTALLDEVVDIFLEDAGGDIEGLQLALSEGNTAGARHLAHTLKGEAGSVGATAVTRISREVELALCANDVATAMCLSLDLHAALQDFRDAAVIAA